jgi:hypothetical protein
MIRLVSNPILNKSYVMACNFAFLSSHFLTPKSRVFEVAYKVLSTPTSVPGKLPFTNPVITAINKQDEIKRNQSEKPPTEPSHSDTVQDSKGEKENHSSKKRIPYTRLSGWDIPEEGDPDFEDWLEKLTQTYRELCEHNSAIRAKDLSKTKTVLSIEPILCNETNKKNSSNQKAIPFTRTCGFDIPKEGDPDYEKNGKTK